MARIAVFASINRRSGTAFSPGRHVLQVTVRDATGLVRHDPTEALIERFQWILEVTP